MSELQSNVYNKLNQLELPLRIIVIFFFIFIKFVLNLLFLNKIISYFDNGNIKCAACDLICETCKEKGKCLSCKPGLNRVLIS